MIIPEKIVPEIVQNVHEFLGRANGVKCFNSAEPYITGTGLKDTFLRLCQACSRCQLNKKRTTKYGKIETTCLEAEPYEVIYTDIIGPFRSSRYKTKIFSMYFSIFTVVDSFSRSVQTTFTTDTSSQFL